MKIEVTTETQRGIDPPLLPCPFRGNSTRNYVQKVEHSRDDSLVYQADCFATGAEARTEDGYHAQVALEAIVLWNTRAI
jgi:hypothetical protein